MDFIHTAAPRGYAMHTPRFIMPGAPVARPVILFPLHILALCN